MDTGEFLTRWSVRLAVFLYLLAWTFRLHFSPDHRYLNLARFAWTVAFVFYILHVLSAFHFYHNWSHAAAYEHTATRTAELIGFHWGGGLYANYAFTIIWLVDVCWWWLSPASYQSRLIVIEWSVHGFMGFIAFNATVVFGQGFIRWFGLAACCMLAVAVIFKMRRRLW